MRLASPHATRLVGLAVLLGLALAVYLSLTASTGLPGQHFRTASAEFDDVGGLRAGDDVRIASVRVGQVRDITFSDGKAHVVMQLDTDQDVYHDASALVVARSALGQNFVMLDPGTRAAGELAEGASLADSRVSSPVNLDQVLSVFDDRTRRATASLLSEAGRGAAGHSEDLHDLLRASPKLLADLELVTQTLADQDTDLDRMLQATARLAGRFDGRSAQLGGLIDHLSTTMDAIAVDGGTQIDGTLRAAPPALDNTTTALRDLRGPLSDLDQGMRALRPGAEALGRSTPTLRAALRESVPVLAKVPGVADDATPAVRSLAGLVADARPLVDRLGKTFASTSRPTAVLAPYTPEFIRFFEDWNSANQYGDASGHYLRIDLVVRPESIDGTVPVRDPLVHRNAYPAPGEATSDRASGLLGEGS